MSEELTLRKLYEVKDLLDEAERNRPKHYNEDGEECILFNSEKE